MNKYFKQGEYIYVPSNVLLFQFPDGDCETTFNYCTKLKTPHHLMFVRPINSAYVSVFYNGCLWALPIEYAYEAKEKQ